MICVRIPTKNPLQAKLTQKQLLAIAVELDYQIFVVYEVRSYTFRAALHGLIATWYRILVY